MNERSFAGNGKFDELVQIGRDDDGFDDDRGIFAPFAKAAIGGVDSCGIESEGGDGSEGKPGHITRGISVFCIGPAQGIFDGEVSGGRFAPAAGRRGDFALEDFGGEPNGGASAGDGQVDGKIDLQARTYRISGSCGGGEERDGERERYGNRTDGHGGTVHEWLNRGKNLRGIRLMIGSLLRASKKFPSWSGRGTVAIAMAYITHIHVEDCRNVQVLDVDLSPNVPDSADNGGTGSSNRTQLPFRHLILTGPNGSGKSGVLEAISEEIFPQFQFIVATHSPALIASIPDAVVYDLRKKKQFLSSDYQGIPYGVVMTEHFGISSDIDLDSTSKLLRSRALAQQVSRTPDETREMEDLATALSARSQILATEVWMVKERLGLSNVQLANLCSF